MGVSGCGKTTVAGLLAQHLGWQVGEADLFHSPANVAKMRAGIPLTDEDRWPWLAAIAAWIDAALAQGKPGVITCSALKRSYRDVIIGKREAVRLVYLQGSYEVIARRIASRQHDYMPPILLQSQFDALEEPGPDENPIVVSVELSPEQIVQRILATLIPAPSGSAPGNPA
ncbi:MAG TPA: gluconokinase [Usitatibacter sp.]|jgi:gluconokinase|nr:gluconokinase [Usitatibacter sp.]